MPIRTKQEKPVVELAIKNFPAQQSIFESPTRNKIVAKGRRFGLTKGAANDFILSGLLGKFKAGLWVDVVNSNIDKYVERYFKPHLMKLPDKMWNWKTQQRILYIKDAYIDFRSADRPENIEGFGYQKYFLNEAGIILKDRYLWHNAIRPMLIEYKATGVIGGTPKGRGLFFELAQKAKSGIDPDYQFFHFTTLDNPYLDKNEIQKEMNNAPDLVRKQEFLAEFIEDSGTVFRGVKSVMDSLPQQPQPNHVYIMGIDLAKVQDFTVITVYDRQTNMQVYQDRFQTLEWPFQKAKIQAISQHYNRALVYLDATGIGDPIADDLLRAGVPVEPIKLTNESKKQIIEKLSIWIDQKKIHLLPIDETYEEF